MQTDATTYQRGREGELIAREYLSLRGFDLLDCNWRHHHLEIDIVAKKQNTLHIIEVKIRRFGGVQCGEEAVTLQKQKKLIRAANAYARLHKRSEELSMDIIAIDYYPDDSIQIRHLQNAFYPF
jgi:putative endonuclease